MNSAVLVLLLVAAAYAAPQFANTGFSTSEVVPILKRVENHDESGQFNLEYETGDGIFYSESGRLVPNVGNDEFEYVLVKEGSVRYTSPEGIPITLTWVADTDGFRAVGDHLPVPVVA